MTFDPLKLYMTEKIILAILSTFYATTLMLYSPPKTSLKNKNRIKKAGFILHILALLANTAMLFMRFLVVWHAPFASLYESLIFLAWAISFIFLISSWYKPAFGYGRAATLSSWIIILASLIIHITNQAATVPRYLPPVLNSIWFGAHALPAFLAYACFILSFMITLSSLTSTEYEVRKKRRAIAEFYLWPGVILFTIALTLGAIASRQAWGNWWIWNKKSVFSLLTWGLFIMAILSRRNRYSAKIVFPIFIILGFIAMFYTYFFANSGLHNFLR